jgi:transposase
MPAGRSGDLPHRVKETPGMVTIGIDAHKHTHTVVIVDDQGQQLAAKTVGTTTADHLALLSCAKKYDEQLAWAVEDCRHLSRRLERDLGRVP